MTDVQRETHAIRESLAMAAPTHRPVGAGELFARILSDWGHIGERRLWRALRWCEANGTLVHVGTKCDVSEQSSGERKSGYMRRP